MPLPDPAKRRQFPAGFKNASIFKDEAGKVLGVVETLTDISELERLDDRVHMLARQYSHDGDFFG